MTRVERRDKAPEPKPEEPKTGGGGISRKEFLEMTGTGIAGLVIGGVVGREVFPKAAAPEAAATPEAAAPAAGGEEAAAESPYKAGYSIVFDPYQCTGCMACAVACSEKYSLEVFPEQTANMVNLEFSRIRPVRF